jgi:Icc-related predicted phosphoesterase
MGQKFKIAAISDTHRQHLDLTPLLECGGDLLVHTGDADCTNESTWTTFINWAKIVSSSFKHGIIFVPGNHDTYIQEYLEDCREDLEGTEIRMLVNEAVELAGLKIFGSPYVPPVGAPQFNAFTAHPGSLAELWGSMPNDLDLLCTHGPASGILDGWCGDAALLEAIRLKKPKIHLFGHIHQESGSTHRLGTLHVNSAIIGSFVFGPFEPTWITYDLESKSAQASELKIMDVT